MWAAVLLAYLGLYAAHSTHEPAGACAGDPGASEQCTPADAAVVSTVISSEASGSAQAAAKEGCHPDAAAAQLQEQLSTAAAELLSMRQELQASLQQACVAGLHCGRHRSQALF